MYYTWGPCAVRIQNVFPYITCLLVCFNWSGKRFFNTCATRDSYLLWILLKLLLRFPASNNWLKLLLALCKLLLILMSCYDHLIPLLIIWYHFLLVLIQEGLLGVLRYCHCRSILLTSSWWLVFNILSAITTTEMLLMSCPQISLKKLVWWKETN